MRTVFLGAVFLLLTASTPVDEPVILFSVWTHKTFTHIEPIALIRRVAFGPDKIEFLKPPREKELAEKYYQPGAKYGVVRGGAEAGSITILPSDNCCCSPVERYVQRTSAPPPANWRSSYAIAIGSLEVPRRASVPRSLTASENSKLLTLVRSVFALKAVPRIALDHIKPENVVAVDLDGDGRTDFIGSFNIDEATNQHRLFTVVMRDAGGALRADVIRYDRALTAKDDMSFKNWTLVDVEDFDGDGIDEIIVANHGWEWTTYDILKMRREAEWDVVYSGGGSGC